MDLAHDYVGDTTILGGTLKLVKSADKNGQVGTGTIITGVDTEKGEYVIDQSTATDFQHTQLITGTGSLTKEGTGTTVLSHGGENLAANDYSFAGPLLIKNGVLELAEKNQLSAVTDITIAATTANGSATFRLDKGSQIHSDARFALGSAQSAASSQSVLDVNGASVALKNITATHGATGSGVTLILRNDAHLAVTEGETLFAGWSNATDHVYVGKDGGTVEVAEGLTVTQNADAALVDWAGQAESLHSQDDVTKSGSGTLILNAKNTYSGSLTIDAGTLQLGTDGATAQTAKLGGVGRIQMNNDATLILNVKDATGADIDTTVERDIDEQGHLVLNRQITGEGNLVQQGAGTAILLANNDYSGTTEIKAGSRLQVGNQSDAALGGAGDIQNAGRLIYSMANNNLTVDAGRAIVGGGEFEQKGANGNHLTLSNTANVLGDLYVTSGKLTATSWKAIKKADLTAHNRLVLGEDPAAAEASTTENTSTVQPRLRVMARRLLAAATTEAASTDPTFEAAFNENTVWDRDIVGSGSFEKTGSGTLTFTDGYSYTQSGTTILNGGGMFFLHNVGMPNSQLVVEKGMLSGDINVHHFAGTSIGGDESTVYIVMKDSSDYTQFWNTGDVNITGGHLKIDLTYYDADKSENFPGKYIPYIFKADDAHQLVGRDDPTAHQFTSYEDTSVLFNFTPLYDYTSTEQGVHLYVQAANADAQTCQAAGMGKVECIERKFGHDHAVNLAKVADKEFRDNPMGIIAQYFYSIDSEERVDNAVIRGLPLFSGSVNQSLQHDVQTAAAYAPRDPCDPSATMHGYNLWARLEQNWDQQGALHGSPGYDGRHSTLALGSDVCLKDNTLRLGVLAGYTNTSMKNHGNHALHSAKTDLYQIGLYGDKQFSDKMDVDFQAGYGRGRVEGHRNLVLFTADSHYGVNLFYAGAGVNWRANDVLTPFVRLDYNYVRADSYKESGAKVFSYNVEHQDRHSGVLQMGSRLDWSPNERWTLSGKAAVGYELLDKFNTVTAAFQGIPNEYFDTRSAEDSRLMGIFEAGVGYKASDKVDFSLQYRAVVKPDYHDQGGQVRMTVHF